MNLLTLEDEKFKSVNVHGLTFKIRYMSPLDRVRIAQKRVSLQDGQPLSSFSVDDIYYFENIAINDICIEEFPKDLKSNESSIKWGDITLINEVAQEIRNHTAELEEKLKKNKPVTGGE